VINREFLMLAHNYKEHHLIGGWFVSEKLDGRRAYWDGGVTRGMSKESVPWANTEKDSRFKAQQISTGLWSRYGNVIHAPDWWLDELPLLPLDGELYGQMPRQEIMSITARLEGRDDWDKVSLHVFDMPAYESVLADGRINNPNYHKQFRGFLAWIEPFVSNGIDILFRPRPSTVFETTYDVMLEKVGGKFEYCRVHKQTRLPFQTSLAEVIVGKMLDEITSSGGEGLILRHPHKTWIPRRMKHVLKVKQLDDMEGVVIGYTTGKGKLLGLMGALVLKLDGDKILELSGFTDAERSFGDRDMFEWACQNPGKRCSKDVEHPLFVRGERVTFRYRGKSKDDVPQEARFWRRYE